MFSIELDVSYESTHQEIVEFAREHDCNATLVTENGPGGGNPVYEFASDNIKSVMELTTDIYGETFDTETLKTMIVEA